MQPFLVFPYINCGATVRWYSMKIPRIIISKSYQNGTTRRLQNKKTARGTFAPITGWNWHVEESFLVSGTKWYFRIRNNFIKKHWSFIPPEETGRDGWKFNQWEFRSVLPKKSKARTLTKFISDLGCLVHVSYLWRNRQLCS